MSGIRAAAAALLDQAVAAYAGTPHEERLVAARRRLDEPLRVAIAGKMKAGKSTLLNALVGEQLAPTDAGECTRIITWYLDSHTSRVTVEPRKGEPAQVPFDRDDGAIQPRLGELAADDVERLVVEWPAQALRTVTLIDTPGIDSMSTDVSQRTYDFLVPGEDRDTPADAVIYLMRHFHASDVRLLEAFHDDEAASASPINAIGVLSRADEIGVGQRDAMATAARIAHRYRTESEVQRLCQAVVPVAGLLAETATTLRQDEFSALAALAGADPVVVDRLLLSVDRFAYSDTPVPIDRDTRAALLRRFGIYGIRVGVDLIRSGRAPSAPGLAAELRRVSGLDELQDVLRAQFTQRADVLKARAALVLLETVFAESPPPGGGEALAAELERLESGAHEFAELRLLNAIRSGGLRVPDAEVAERLLGAEGSEIAARLGLPADADPEAVRGAGLEALAHWKSRAEDPMASRELAAAADVLVRTCEGLVAAAAG